MILYFKQTEEIIEFKTDIAFGRVNGDMTFPDDDLCSSSHGRFFLQNNKAHIQDLGSTNGTFLNKQQLPAQEEVELQEGDHIRFGEQEVIFSNNPNFDPSEFEEVSKEQRGQQLLAKVKKQKENKLHELEAKKAGPVKSLQTLQSELAQIAEKQSMASKLLSEIEQKIQSYQQKAEHIENNITEINRTFEIKKKPLYDKQGGLMDQLRLKDTVGAPEEEKIPLQKELDEVNQRLAEFDLEKKGQPLKAKQFRQKIESYQGKKLEVMAQKDKIEQFLQDKKSQYSPQITKLKEEIAGLDSLIGKAQEDLKR